MITSNTKYPFGGKVGVVETTSFNCMISTAKESFFKKQSTMFSDLSRGMQNRKHVAKLFFGEKLSSLERLRASESIATELDRLGMSGESLTEALKIVFYCFEENGISAGFFYETEITKLWES